MNDFKEEYTTAEKKAADTKGTEANKTILSNDAFAVSELLQRIIIKLNKLGV